MKKIAILFGLLILNIYLPAQNLIKKTINNLFTIPSLFDFNEDNDDYYIKKSGGVLVISNHDYSDWYFWDAPNQILLDHDFSLETELEILEHIDDEDNIYGLIWYNKGTETGYMLYLYPSTHQYKLEVQKDDEDLWSSGIKECSCISNKLNRLKIKKIKGVFLVYINSKLVEIVPAKYGIYSETVGIIAGAGTYMRVNYMKLSGYVRPILIANTPFSDKEKKNLGSNVNTYAEELLPRISPDGKILYFIRDDYDLNIGGQDIWYSELQGEDQWSEAKNIGRPINTDYSEAVFFIAPDNNTIYLSHRYTAFGEYSGEGISVSHRTTNGWSMPENVEIEGFYNDNDYKNFALSADQQVLISALERDDSRGDLDLYVSFRKSDGSYTEPINMGEVINSYKCECSPFLASDGVTLYFASEGHPGYGSADIFVTRRLDNTWLKWSTPRNLGPAINTADWDAYFTIDAKGEYAYLVSYASGYGGSDIFRMKIKEEDRPNPVVLVYGKVYDKETNKVISTNIVYTDLKTGKKVATALSNPLTGEYKIVLPYGTRYNIYAKYSGYYPLTDYIAIDTVQGYKEIRKDLYLVPIKQDESIVLKTIFFRRGSAKLLSDSYEELDRLAKFLKENPEVKIEISGHTNNIGNGSELIKLSEDRAKAVKDYLVNKGIRSDRITTVGYGPDKPIASNETEEGRKKNQRVEFKITKILK